MGKKSRPFESLKVYIGPHLPNRKARQSIWRKKLEAGGGCVQEELDATATHAVVDPADLVACFRTRGVSLVSPSWLQDTLASGKPQQEAGYLVVESANSPVSVEFDAPSLQRWLGHWSSEFNHEPPGQLHLMLQATYNSARCEAIGNMTVVQQLTEMMKCEQAIDVADIEDDRHTAFRALTYAHAAAAMHACAYKVEASVQPGDLPYVGPSIALQIRDLIETGSCLQLQQMRSGSPVVSGSQGERRGSQGASVRAQFCRLPGVGNKTAQRWFNQGLRTFEDVIAACRPGGMFGDKRGISTITREAYFSLLHRDSLLQDTSADEVEEMEAAVRSSVLATEGSGWLVLRAGGAARGRSSHDVDFIITCENSNRPTEGAVHNVVGHLLHNSRLFPGELVTGGISDGAAMFRIQSGRMAGHIDRMKTAFLDSQLSSHSRNLGVDRFDRFFGVFSTYGGRAKRIDLIFVPFEELGFGYLGWVGGRQYLRFLRQFAADASRHPDIKSSMHLNSHGLLAKLGDTVWQVPQEGPPIDFTSGHPKWPPGWQQNRPVTTERDVFELLSVPYQLPSDRNC